MLTVSLENPGDSKFHPDLLEKVSPKSDNIKAIHKALLDTGALEFLSFYYDNYMNDPFARIEKWNSFQEEMSLEALQKIKSLEVRNYSDEGIVSLLHLGITESQKNPKGWVEVPTTAVALMVAAENLLTEYGSHRIRPVDYARLWESYLSTVIEKDIKDYVMTEAARMKYAILAASHTLIEINGEIKQIPPIVKILPRTVELFELDSNYSLVRLRVLAELAWTNTVNINEVKDAPFGWLTSLLPEKSLKKPEGYAIGFRSMFDPTG